MLPGDPDEALPLVARQGAAQLLEIFGPVPLSRFGLRRGLDGDDPALVPKDVGIGPAGDRLVGRIAAERGHRAIGIEPPGDLLGDTLKPPRTADPGGDGLVDGAW